MVPQCAKQGHSQFLTLKLTSISTFQLSLSHQPSTGLRPDFHNLRPTHDSSQLTPIIIVTMSGTQATIPQDPANAEGVSENKGKGKAPAEDVPQDAAMNEDDDDDDSSSDEEEEEVCKPPNIPLL